MRLEAERVERERAEAARLEQERLEQARIEEERLERERAEAARLEQARLEQARLEQERLEREQAEKERAERERAERVRAEAEAAQARAASQATPIAEPSAEEAEKTRKAEAAAALMRLYSPYGSGGLGRPLTPVQPQKPAPQPQVPPQAQPQLAPQLATPAPQPESRPDARSASVETPRAADPEPDDEPLPAVVSFALKPAQSASNMPPPQITALNPYARPIPKDDAVVEVPRPKAVDLSGAAPGSDSLNWREQLQRPLPPGYQASQPAPAQPAAVQPAQAAQYADAFEDTFGADSDWTNDDGRVALTVDEAGDDGASWWKMIRSTFWWILFSALGLACLGFAAATYYRARFDPNVARMLGGEADLTLISILSAAGGILFVCISVWLIMKRLGGLKD